MIFVKSSLSSFEGGNSSKSESCFVLGNSSSKSSSLNTGFFENNDDLN